MQTWQLLRQNPALWGRYTVKQDTLRAIRMFFEQRNYRELESPILAPALPSERYVNFLTTQVGERELYLIPTTERFNKIALAAGIGNHFVITKVFRNMEKLGPNHSPEFTMLEWYHLNGNYFDLMDDTEQLVQAILRKLGKDSLQSEYQGQMIDFGSPWHRFSVSELLQKYADINLAHILEWGQIKQKVIDLGLLQNHHVSESEMSWQDLFELIFFNKVEVHLDPSKPTFIYDYPRILCPLTQPNANNPMVSEKVELYIAGREVANGYTELLDAELLHANFEVEQKARAKMGLPLAKFDDELVSALAAGLPPVAGIGMGIDRLVMILADAKSVSEINLFPLS
jgi:lysyl-tRNA synthetase class 2